MPLSDSVITFIIVSFVFALIIILKRDTIPPAFKRPLAIFSIVLILCSFGLILYSAFQLI